LLEHRLVELRLREQPLEPAVLDLELLESARFVGLHALVLGPPTVPAALRDLEVTQHLREVRTLVQEPITLAELADDLVRRVPVTLHRGVLHPSMLGVGLPQHVDHYPGAGSRAPRHPALVGCAGSMGPARPRSVDPEAPDWRSSLRPGSPAGGRIARE